MMLPRFLLTRSSSQAVNNIHMAVQIRSQGTIAISRHTNDSTANSNSNTNINKTINNKKSIIKNQHSESSTIHHANSHHDYFSSLSSLKRDDGDYYFEAHAEAFLTAQLQQQQQQLQQQQPNNTTNEKNSVARSKIIAKAFEMDLIQSSNAVHDRESYDKILILMRHGEGKHNVFEREWLRKSTTTKLTSNTTTTMEEANGEEDYPLDPMLTGKGCGQMLALSRQTATYLNRQTGLTPDLVVVSPLKRAIQSAFIAFPTQTPLTSLTNIPWICHPNLMERANGHKSEMRSESAVLKEMFPGVDFGLLQQEEKVDGISDSGSGHSSSSTQKVPLFESKIDLMGRTDEFLRWIQEREERVIVVSSHATWLQSLCASSLQYEPNSKGIEMFKKGEMRSVGIKFE